jgi:argininosuccinate lyase
MTTQKKPWGGRFKEQTNRIVEAFTASLSYDRRLYRHDIEGSMAHCRMLAKTGLITRAEARQMIAGLEGIRKDIEKGAFKFSIECEDIHMAVETALIERIGEAGGKLHTGRSRNDQISLDMRLYLRDEVLEILVLLDLLKACLVASARKEIDTILPGYTHLQKAQPILLAHYLLAYWEMLERDEGRLLDCYERINVMPLGSAALAGTGLKIDRAFVAKLLGFPRLTRNSLDAVSDRDFVAEFIFVAGLLMMHLSRLCEDLVIWSSEEFGYVEISDAFTTGSSIMPQKKNPDVAELIRGKTGRVYGSLVSILTVLKALPLSYNRDLQEDKEPLFDTVDTVKECIAVLAALMENVRFNRKRMFEEAARGFATATDVAEYLVMKGVAFREAHRIVGEVVGYCLERGKTFEDLTLKELRSFYGGFDRSVYSTFGVARSVQARDLVGGTAKKAVLRRIEDIERSEGHRLR